jgi:hypothetical protein
MTEFKNLKLYSLPFLLFCLFLSTSIQAQTTKAPVKSDGMEKSSTKVPYCDEVAGFYGPDMQTRANQECRTIYPCVECTERSNSKKNCVQMVVQPDKNSKCNVKVTEVGDPKTLQANHPLPKLDQKDFEVSIIQTPCYFDGVSLQVLANTVGMPGLEPPGGYSYTWTVDDLPMGSANNVYCVSGKTASVKVMQVATARTKTLTVAIEKGIKAIEDKPLPVANSVTKPVAVYQKTSCFGNCPAYVIEIFRDGTVTWNGHANILPLGKKKGKVGLDVYAKLEEKAQAIGFLKLNNAYPEDKIEDAAATVIYMNLDGTDKQVRNVFGAPEGLVELQKMFDVMIQNLGWARTKPMPMQKKLEAPGKNNKASEN